MKPYEIIEHTADVRLKVNGNTLKELFENAALGMFDIIGVSPGIKPEIKKKIKIEKNTEIFEELLVEWLSELLYVFNKYNMLFCSFKVLELNEDGVLGEASGYKIDLANTSLKTEIKAVTFHDLKIEEDIKGFNCKIVFDV